MTELWWQMSDNRRLMSDVWWQRYDIRRLKSDVWWQMFDVRRLTSYVWGEISDVWWLMCNVSRPLQSLYVCVSLVNTLISTRADWISNNLHEISSRYLRTMGKEFNFQFSRRSWGRNRSCGVSRGVTNPWERLRGRLHKHFLFLFLNSDTALWHAFQPQRTSPRFNKLNESE